LALDSRIRGSYTNFMKKILISAFLICAPIVFAQGHHSGIAGQVALVICPVSGPGGCPPHPYRGSFSIYDEKGKLVEALKPDEDGSFSVDLKPGNYWIVPISPTPPQIYPNAAPQEVEVEFKQYTQVQIIFDGGI